MNKVLRNSVALVAAVLITTGCASWSHQQTGTAVGAVAGGVVGNVVTGGSVVGTAVGAVGGGLIGHEVSQ